MTEKRPVDCLLITGMHRSGLSALAESLALMGIDFGHTEAAGKTKSYVRAASNGDVVMIHDLLLRDLGCTWNMIGALPQGWLQTPAAAKAKERILRLLENQFQSRGLWAVADPRLCRLLPLWVSTLAEKGITPGIVVTIRHPWEVAQSLEEKHAMDVQQSHLLWLALYKEAFDVCQQHSHFVHTYDQLLADPAAVLNELQESFGLVFPRPIEQHIQRLLDGVRPELKHFHRSNFKHRDGNGESYYPFAWFYDQVNNHRAALKLLAQKPDERVGQDRLEHADVAANLYSETLPAFSEELAVQKQSTRQGGKIFNAFLALIGQYERDQRDLELQKLKRILSTTSIPETLFARLSLPSAKEGQSAETADTLLVKNEWQLLRFPINRPDELKTDRLTFFPLNTRGIVSISALRLVNLATEDVCWKAATADAFETIELVNALRLPAEDALDCMTTGNDAHLVFPVLRNVPDCPLSFQVWIKVDTRQEAVASAWQTLNRQKGRLQNQLEQALEKSQAIEAELGEKANQLSDKEREMAAAARENQNKIISLKSRADESQVALKERDEALSTINSENKELRAHVARHESTIKTITREKEKFEALAAQSRSALEEQKEAVAVRFKEIAELTRILKEKEKFEASAVQSRSALEELKTAVAVRFKEIAELTRILKENENALTETAKSLSEQQEKVGRLEEMLSQKSESIKALEGKSRELEAELSEKDHQLHSHQEKMEAISSELAQKSWKLSSLEAKIERRDDLIQQLRAELENKKQRLSSAMEERQQLSQKLMQREKTLQVKETQIETQKKRLEKIKHSASWKVMAPARALTRPFRKRSYRAEPDEVQIEQIRASSYFDSDWYLQQYPDVADNQLDPAEHYFYFGVSEGRDPGPDFNTAWYLQAYQDTAETGINPLFHYIKYGKAEGRSPNDKSPHQGQIELVKTSDYFDADWYVEQYPQVKTKKLDPAVHYCTIGAAEGKNPGPDFDTTWYTETYPDVAESGTNPLVHYLTFGQKEGRKCKAIGEGR